MYSKNMDTINLENLLDLVAEECDRLGIELSQAVEESELFSVLVGNLATSLDEHNLKIIRN
jgi:hypothetical protein